MATKVTAPTATGDGFTPETGIVAEYANDEFNVLSTWVEWLSFGSNAAGLDAHVVETDSAGKATLSRLELGGTAGASAALLVNGNTSVPFLTAQFNNTSSGNCVLANGTTSAAALRAVNAGTGAAIEAATNTAGTNAIIAIANGAGAGIVSTGGATGQGGTFTGGATSGHGVQGTAIGAQAGVRGISSTTAANSQGLLGSASRNDGAGIQGLALIVGADPTSGDAAAIAGVGTDATALFGLSTNGYGVWAQSDTTTPARAALHIEPQNATPITVLEGDVWYDSVEDQLKVRQDGTTMGIWATGHGYTYLYGENRAQVNETTTTWADSVTASFVANMEPRENSALVTITVCFEFGASSTGASFQWRVNDTTAAAFPFDNGGTPADGRIEEVHHSGATADDRYLTQKVQYTIPVAGPREFKIQIRSVDGFITSRIRRASLEITGSHG